MRNSSDGEINYGNFIQHSSLFSYHEASFVTRHWVFLEDTAGLPRTASPALPVWFLSWAEETCLAKCTALGRDSLHPGTSRWLPGPLKFCRTDGPEGHLPGPERHWGLARAFAGSTSQPQSRRLLQSARCPHRPGVSGLFPNKLPTSSSRTQSMLPRDLYICQKLNLGYFI